MTGLDGPNQLAGDRIIEAMMRGDKMFPPISEFAKANKLYDRTMEALLAGDYFVVPVAWMQEEAPCAFCPDGKGATHYSLLLDGFQDTPICSDHRDSLCDRLRKIKDDESARRSLARSGAWKKAADAAAEAVKNLEAASK